jgi:uncharacterized protein YkwD
MRLIGKKAIVLGACLAFFLALTQGLHARRPPSPQSVHVSYLSELERAIYHYTNEVRQRNGVATLTWENSLRDVARAHSADMLVKDYFSHVNPEGQSFKDRILAGCSLPMTMMGENIWMTTGRQHEDTRQLAQNIVDSWMSSPGHRANLLQPEFSDMGVGAAVSGNNIKVTQVFIRHREKR